MLGQHEIVDDLAGEHPVQHTVHLFGRHVLEAQAGPAGKLNVDQRLGRAQADAADLDHVGLDFMRVEIGTDRVERRLAAAEAAGARPHVDHGAHQGFTAEFGETLLALLARAGSWGPLASRIQARSSG